MEITITPQENSSLTKEISLNLKGYTVFAGENNSGKTNLIKGIISEIGKDKVIYIPAENIHAQEVIKTSAASDPMRDAVSKLLKIVLSDTPPIEGDFETLFKKIETAFEKFEVPNTSLKLSPKSFGKTDFEKILRDAIASKILDSKILDNHYESENTFDFGSVGQGIQRLIIATIIQEIGKTKINDDELVILFEEPEIYLHPKLKKKLFESLIKISEENPNVDVVVTTHDPYFIQLSRDKEIYQVSRDSDGATEIKTIENKVLPEDWRSFAEINYKVFDVNAEDYLNELYGYLESKLGAWKSVENEIKTKEAQNQTRQYLGNSTTMTMTSYVRHEIHHRTGENEYNEDDIKTGIKNLETIISEKGF